MLQKDRKFKLSQVPTPKRPKSSALSSPPSISLSIPSTPKIHAQCFLCKRPGPKLVLVPSNARFDVFMNCEIIVPAGSRCCHDHLENGEFKADMLHSIKTANNSLLSRTSITELIKSLRTAAQQNENRRIDFESSSNLTNNDYLDLTGICKDAFNEICASALKDVRNTPARTTRTSLGIFLFKLKSGLSNKILSTIFNISKSSLHRPIASFVPQNLGLQHISREEVIEKQTKPLAQTLFGDIGNSQVILVLDGTYIYIQKSNNFHFQRRSYSVHKGRPLVKAMVVVTTTGHFVTAVGPYLADNKNNDANFLTQTWKTLNTGCKKMIYLLSTGVLEMQ